jgi:hypothetical protein
MQPTRQLIGGIILGVAIVAAIAGTTYDGGLGRFYGDTVLTNLLPGAVYYNTSNSTFWVGGVSSNPVKVGDAAWSNLVSATGVTTNIGFLNLATNASTLYITNGSIKGVSTP